MTVECLKSVLDEIFINQLCVSSSINHQVFDCINIKGKNYMSLYVHYLNFSSEYVTALTKKSSLLILVRIKKILYFVKQSYT